MNLKNHDKIKRYMPLLFGFAIFFILLIAIFFNNYDIGLQDCVAVAHIDGELVSSTQVSGFSQAVIGSDVIAKNIKDLSKKKNIKAVVFIVNSPGGSVVASQEIYDAIRSLKVPKVIYIRELAASGGYFVSLAGDYIVINKHAITGSIGVIAEAPNLKGLLDKMGINMTVIKSKRHKDFLSPFKSPDKEEIAIMQSIINEAYNNFVNLVKQRRKGKINLAYKDKIFDGRIMSANQALHYGLVDEIASFDDAVEKAKALAGDKQLSVCNVNIKKMDYWHSLIGSVNSLISPILALNKDYFVYMLYKDIKAHALELEYK